MYLLSVLPLILFLIFYNQLPDRIPGHWNLDGTVRYDSKNTFFLISGLTIFLAALFDAMPRIDPRKKNYVRFEKYYDFFCIFFVVFMDMMCSIILIESKWPGTLPVEKVVIYFVGLLFMVTGNIMPKIKSNFYFGIKTSWSLSDNDVWNKSNRLGGQLMFWSGLVLMGSALVFNGNIVFGILMVMVVVIAAVPTLMSYVWYRKKYR